jgi:hypothetical protein
MPSKNKDSYPDDNWTASNIEKYGLAVILLEATDYLPAFGYSIGLWQRYKHPEIISFGLSTKVLHEIINLAGAMVVSGKRIETGVAYDDFFEACTIRFVPVDPRNLADYFGYATGYYQYSDFPALQLVWPDQKQKFPWEPDFDVDLQDRQPLLDRNADFKFFEARNLGIFTTRQWLDLQRPILRVVHDTDGDWQFLTEDQMPDDIRLVCLEDMVIRDRTLNEVFNLGYGEAATREYVGGAWTWSENTQEEA